VVVDDVEPTRRGIKQLLESHSGWKVVGEAADGDTGIQVVKDLEPDIVTTDVAHPGLDGLQMARWIAQNLPKVRVLIVTMHASKQLVREILEAGARGYVMTSDAGKDLVKAVETVLEDKLFFTQTISEILLDGFLEKPQPMRPENLLTKRETEIVALLARGRNNKEVATELHISLRTAETHRANIMNKLQSKSMQDLVRYAVKNKLVDL
jgi:DNA-binding NarL/FixJ family response regulator